MGVAIPINSAGVASGSTAPPVIATVRKLSSFRRMKNKVTKNGKFFVDRSRNKKAGSDCDRTEDTAEMSRSGEGDHDDDNNNNNMYYPVDIINGDDQAASAGSELSLPMELENNSTAASPSLSRQIALEEFIKSPYSNQWCELVEEMSVPSEEELCCPIEENPHGRNTSTMVPSEQSMRRHDSDISGVNDCDESSIGQSSGQYHGRGTHGDQGCDESTIDQYNKPYTARGCQSGQDLQHQSPSSYSCLDPPPSDHPSKRESSLVSTATVDSQGKCPHHQFIQLKRVSPRTGECQTLMDCCPLCEAAEDGSIAGHSVLVRSSSKIATAHRRRLMQQQSRLHSQPMYQPVNTDDYVDEASDDDDDGDYPTITPSNSHLPENDEEGESSIVQRMEHHEALMSIAKLQSGNDAIRQSMNEVSQLANKMDEKVAYFIQYHNANVKGYEEKVSMMKDEVRRKENLFAILDAMREENEVLVSLMIMGEEDDDESFVLSEEYTEEEVMELIAEKEEEAYEREDDDAELTCKVLQVELTLLWQTLGELEGRDDESSNSPNNDTFARVWGDTDESLGDD